MRHFVLKKGTFLHKAVKALKFREELEKFADLCNT